MHHLTLPLLEKLVMRARMADNRELFEDASPLFRVHRDAPPFFILHGRSPTTSFRSPRPVRSTPHCGIPVPGHRLRRTPQRPPRL